MGFKGNIVSANAIVSSATSASGVWKTSEQIQGMFGGSWPGSPFASYTINYLVVAGGGAGGGRHAEEHPAGPRQCGRAR